MYGCLPLRIFVETCTEGLELQKEIIALLVEERYWRILDDDPPCSQYTIWRCLSCLIPLVAMVVFDTSYVIAQIFTVDGRVQVVFE
mmetsp:Transcript_19550/g.24641  ORF Transcript_19550/g.24641 Transcript_19550/m.24641 type:complete len:86 (-) Transcript_19550:45-302(-)